MSLPVFALRSPWLTAALLVCAARLAAAEPTPGPAIPALTATVLPSPEAPAHSPTTAPVASPEPTPASNGPLGATPQEITKFYGPVLKHNARVRHHQVLEGGTALDGDLHGREDFIIRVVYHEGRTVLLEFTRVDKALTQADVTRFLGTMAGGAVWVQGRDSTEQSKYYRRSDDRAVAHFATGYDGSLLVSAEGRDRDKFLDNILR